MNPVIRAATVGDASGLAGVHVAAWQWAYAGLLPAAQLGTLSADGSAERWRSRLSDREGAGSTLVADDGGRVVGFVTVGPGRADVGGPEVGEVVGLYVLAEVAGSGAGRRLHDAGLARLAADGHSLARLWVLATNARARRFYERCGWQADGVTKVETLQEGLVLDEVRYTRALTATGQGTSGQT